MIISNLISEAVTSFSAVDRACIDSCRLSHRLTVVQGLEDSSMKNVVRALRGRTVLTEEEIQVLFLVVKNCQLVRGPGHRSRSSTAETEPGKRVEVVDGYRLDWDTWQWVAAACSRWSASPAWPTLSHRLFSVLAAGEDTAGLREAVTVVGVLAGGDPAARLRLLYCLHLPGVVLPGELEVSTVL